MVPQRRYGVRTLSQYLQNFRPNGKKASVKREVLVGQYHSSGLSFKEIAELEIVRNNASRRPEKFGFKVLSTQRIFY